MITTTKDVLPVLHLQKNHTTSSHRIVLPHGSCRAAAVQIFRSKKCASVNKATLHASREDYLEAILVLQKQKGMVRSVDVARHMEVSKPSVSHAVTTLKEGGLLTMDEDFFLHLTDLGREIAEQTYEKHRFFTNCSPKPALIRHWRSGTPAGWSMSSAKSPSSIYGMPTIHI